MYVEYASGEKEYYDLVKDPYQLQNQAASLPAATLTRLSGRVGELKKCAGATCRAAEGTTGPVHK